VNKLLEKLLEEFGSSKNLAYKIIDIKNYNDDAKRISDLVRKWKSIGKIPKKWENILKEVAKESGIKLFDEKDNKLLECLFINLIKDIKIAFYEKKEISKEKGIIFLILMLSLDKEFVFESIEKENLEKLV